MKWEEDVKREFKVGDVIRSVNPYWGEGTYTIMDVKKYGFSCAPNSSKHAPAWERHGSKYSFGFLEFINDVEDEYNYKKSSIFIRTWLWSLGNTLGRISRLTKKQ